MYGLYHPFEFDYKNNIKENVIMKTPILDFILTGTDNIKLLNWNNGENIGISKMSRSWVINDVEFNSTRIYASIPTSGQYVIVVDDFWYSPIIEYSNCNILQFLSKGICSNQYHDWDSDGTELNILMSEAQMLTPEILTGTITIVTNKGEVQKSVNQIIKNRIQFLGTNGYNLLFNSMKTNEESYFNTNVGAKKIKNIEVEAIEQLNGQYSLFTIKFEYYDDIVNASSCCDVLNIDDIINPENPNGDDIVCTGFAVEINKTDDVLTASVSNEPLLGVLVYRWYKNGTLISTGVSADASESGEYRVDAVKSNCRASAIYLIQNECDDFTLNISKIQNEIYGSVSNVPMGQNVVYSIKLNGVEVGTDLPYTAVEDGIYYVEVTAGECKKVKAINIKLVEEDCDFTLSITEDGGVLTGVTDALTPVYKWELDNGEGKVIIGNANTQQIEGSGIYWLTITNGLCEKSVYFVKLQSNKEIHSILHRVTGNEFNVIGIDMNNDKENINVFVNGVKYEYSAAPSSPIQWGVNSLGKLILSSAHSVTNATIRVSKI